MNRICVTGDKEEILTMLASLQTKAMLLDKNTFLRIDENASNLNLKIRQDISTAYGYLAYKHIEMYGVNSKQLVESDLVKQTKYLHTYFSKTIPYIALENVGDGCYAIVSAEDEVYEYSSESDVAKDTGLKLFDYILKRFEEVDA